MIGVGQLFIGRVKFFVQFFARAKAYEFDGDVRSRFTTSESDHIPR